MRHQPHHGFAGNGDTTGCVGFAGGEVKEYRAAPVAVTNDEVVIHDEADVVKPVITPHLLVRRCKRQIHRPVIGGMRRIIAPAIGWRQGLQGQFCRRRADPVRPVKAEQQFVAAGWCGTVALVLVGRYSGFSQQAGNCRITSQKKPRRWVFCRLSPYFQCVVRVVDHAISHFPVCNHARLSSNVIAFFSIPIQPIKARPWKPWQNCPRSTYGRVDLNR